MVTVIARLRVTPETVDLAKAEMLQLVAATVQEAGCLRYELHQAADDPSVFVFYEEWSSDEALALHLKSPHMKAHRTASDGFVIESSFSKLTRLT